MCSDFRSFSDIGWYRSANGIIALVAVLFLGGCAFTTGHVDLSYQPSTDVAKVAEAESPPVAVQVIDKRPTKTVGQKINWPYPIEVSQR